MGRERVQPRGLDAFASEQRGSTRSLQTSTTRNRHYLDISPGRSMVDRNHLVGQHLGEPERLNTSFRLCEIRITAIPSPAGRFTRLSTICVCWTPRAAVGSSMMTSLGSPIIALATATDCR
jgi:hypothetical protein